MEKISVVIHTYNSEKHLRRVLEAVRGFDEILICDMHSTDSTLSIAEEFGCRVVFHDKIPYPEPARNFAIRAAANDRVLVVDSDEVIPAALREYLYRQTERPDCPEGIRIPRKNHFMGRFMHSDYPDYILRFMDRRHAEWESCIHGRPIVRGRVETIPRRRKELAIIHLCDMPMAARVAKTNLYTDMEVERRRGKRYGVASAIFAPMHRFVKAYLLKGGFRDGRAGLVNATMDAFYRFILVVKMWERRDAAPTRGEEPDAAAKQNRAESE